MHYVYILQSIFYPKQIYIGCTSNLKQRIQVHNKAQSSHTSKYHPWHLKNYFAFQEKNNAYDFEKYLKSHSGRAFSKRNFLK